MLRCNERTRRPLPSGFDRHSPHRQRALARLHDGRWSPRRSAHCSSASGILIVAFEAQLFSPRSALP